MCIRDRVYDEVFPVENEDAFTVGKLIAKHEGILVGISSGAALYAAIQLAKRPAVSYTHLDVYKRQA